MENSAKKSNVLCVISKSVFGEHGVRDIQTNSCWYQNPYGDQYAVVPENLVEDIIETSGFCDIELNEDGTEVVSFTKREIPETITKNKKPTTEERLAALEMAMLEQIGVVTE